MMRNKGFIDVIERELKEGNTIGPEKVGTTIQKRIEQKRRKVETERKEEISKEAPRQVQDFLNKPMQAVGLLGNKEQRNSMVSERKSAAYSTFGQQQKNPN